MPRFYPAFVIFATTAQSAAAGSPSALTLQGTKHNREGQWSGIKNIHLNTTRENNDT